jgi:hypothetical protein
MENFVIANNINTLSEFSRGEIEMQSLADNPVAELRRAWPIIKAKTGWVESWLQEQYFGEVSALASMEILLETIKQQVTERKCIMLVERVLADERKHVQIIGQLLKARGETPRLNEQPNILSGMDTTYGNGCALASRAEAVRLGKIRVVVGDEDVPEDVRGAFTLILQEESFHERAFRRLAGEEKMFENFLFGDWGQISGFQEMRVAEKSVSRMGYQ